MASSHREVLLTQRRLEELQTGNNTWIKFPLKFLQLWTPGRWGTPGVKSILDSFCSPCCQPSLSGHVSPMKSFREKTVWTGRNSCWPPRSRSGTLSPLVATFIQQLATATRSTAGHDSDWELPWIFPLKFHDKSVRCIHTHTHTYI